MVDARLYHTYYDIILSQKIAYATSLKSNSFKKGYNMESELLSELMILAVLMQGLVAFLQLAKITHKLFSSTNANTLSQIAFVQLLVILFMAYWIITW